MALKSPDRRHRDRDAAVPHPDNLCHHPLILSNRNLTVPAIFINALTVLTLCISSLLKTGFRVPKRRLNTLLAGLGVENAHIDGYPSSAPAAMSDFDSEARQKRQFTQLVNLTQRFLREAASRRQRFFWDKTDTSSLDTLGKRHVQDAKTYFWEEVIGKVSTAGCLLQIRELD